MPQVHSETDRRPIVPKEFGGKWIAWNRDTTRFIASADDLEAVARAAREAGEEHPSFEKVPPADTYIIGAAR
jgi:hypothetical protein